MSAGALLVVTGLSLAGLGVLVHFGALDWFGHLPGDIRIERGQTRVFIPITSMIVVSIVISAVVHVIRRLLG